MLYWLRRIPAETRIVVLVVFVALFQAILLSIFGLGAIRGERRQVREQVQADAYNFLREYVARPARNALRDAADAVFQAAFEEGDSSWRERPDPPGGGIFSDAFAVRPDGRILGPDGLLLYCPFDLLAEQDQIATREAAELMAAYREGMEEREKALLDLELALAHPFAFERDGWSLPLLQAASPLLVEGWEPDARTLLRARRVGVLNRVAGHLSAGTVERFLRRIDAAGESRDGFAEGVREQERRAAVLGDLRREMLRIPRTGPASLHRDPAGRAFYVRRLGEGELQILAVDEEELRAFLDGVAKRAAKEASRRGVVRPRIAREGEAPERAATVAMSGLEGFEAVARISDESLRARSGERERFYWYIIGFSVAGILAGGFWTAQVVMREVRLAKMKSGFVSNVTHELKTPLTSIRMFVEMLRGGKIEDERERRECLGVIASETERLGKLIQRVLDFSRLDARKRRFRWTVAPLTRVVRAEAERFRRATGLDEEAFRVHIAVNVPPVQHDPEAFAEVVTNLLSNAYKYTSPERREIDLTLGVFRGRVLLSVEDNGPGVPARERQKIFEQFYRANDYLAREVEGTGLGLSIARNIVRAHGGRIWVEDRPGGGSRFLVLLRAAGPPRRPARGPSPAEAAR